MQGKERAAFLDKFVSWGIYDEDLAAQIRGGKIFVK
jgi:hypothetical protein